MAVRRRKTSWLFTTAIAAIFFVLCQICVMHWAHSSLDNISLKESLRNLQRHDFHENDLTREERIVKRRKEKWEELLQLSYAKMESKRLPTVIGIGAKKCGADTLMSFIEHHPLVRTPENVETSFFNKKYSMGLEYYRSLMPFSVNHDIVMENTPVYFNSPPAELPYVMSKVLPNVKLILVLCDPVMRSFSDYTHERESQNDALAQYETFDAYLDVYLKKIEDILNMDRMVLLREFMDIFYADHASTILSAGLYSVFLPRWLYLFGNTSRLMILDGEEILRDPGSQVERMQDFLQIPSMINKGDFVRHPATGHYCIRPWWKSYDYEAEYRNATGWEKGLSCPSNTKGRTRSKSDKLNATAEHKEALKKLYRPFNEELNRMISDQPNKWWM